jgi:hypothetical protein
MPEFAQFIALTGTDTPITLAQGTPSTRSGFIIDLPGLDPSRTVIVMFKVHGNAGSRLIMENSPTSTSVEVLIDFVLDSTFTKPRSWHEIVPGKAFSSSQNKFSMSLSNLPAAGETIHVSDIVILYHAKSV